MLLYLTGDHTIPKTSITVNLCLISRRTTNFDFR